MILFVASIAATRGLSDRFACSMTKGAVLAMRLSLYFRQFACMLRLWMPSAKKRI